MSEMWCATSAMLKSSRTPKAAVVRHSSVVLADRSRLPHGQWIDTSRSCNVAGGTVATAARSRWYLCVEAVVRDTGPVAAMPAPNVCQETELISVRLHRRGRNPHMSFHFRKTASRWSAPKLPRGLGNKHAERCAMSAVQLAQSENKHQERSAADSGSALPITCGH